MEKRMEHEMETGVQIVVYSDIIVVGLRIT